MVSMVLGVLQDGRAQPFYEMTDLAELGIVSANCLNNRGVVAGVNREADELILVERGRVVARAAWPGGQISPHAINDRNDVVGNVFFASKPAQSFRFTGGQFTEIPALPGHELSYPVGINNSGMILMRGLGGTLGDRGYRWIDGVLTEIGHLGEPGLTWSVAINSRGAVAGHASVAAFTPAHAFLWDGSSMTDLGGLNGGRASYGLGLNDQNVVVGSASPSPEVTDRRGPVAFSGGRAVNLDPSAASGVIRITEALGVNNLSAIIGTSPRAAIWLGGRKYDLDDCVDRREGGRLLTVARPIAINDRGQILAEVMTPEFELRVALLSPVRKSSSPSRIINLSGRAAAGVDSTTAIAGFVLGVGGSGKLLLRTAGPSLSSYGVSNAARDPAIYLYDGDGAFLEQNDDWGEGLNGNDVRSVAARVGAFPYAEESLDAALVVQVPPGSYSTHALNRSDPDGIVLAEVYDADGGASAGLVNASIRMRIGAGDATGIAGFVIGGEDPCTVLVRSVGPALKEVGVDGHLEDPVLWLYRDQNPYLGNDDWGSPEATPLLYHVMQRIGAFGIVEGSKDAALLATLTPGAYSVHVTGKNGQSGVALAEIYLVPESALDAALAAATP